MKSKSFPIIIAIAIPLVSIIIALLLVFFKHKSASTQEQFPYERYINPSENIQGNKYSVVAVIDKQLADLGDMGRVVIVKIEGEKNPVAVLIPTNIGVNITAQQRYKMTVVIKEKGRIVVDEMQKF